MAKNRLIGTTLKIFDWYVFLISVVFFLWQIFVWAMYTSEYNQPEYCLEADPGQSYDFMIGSVPCNTDWMYFINEPLLGSALIYLIFVGPIALAGFFLKRFLNKNVAAA